MAFVTCYQGGVAIRTAPSVDAPCVGEVLQWNEVRKAAVVGTLSGDAGGRHAGVSGLRVLQSPGLTRGDFYSRPTKSIPGTSFRFFSDVYVVV